MNHIDYLRIYSDSDGHPHFEEKTIDLESKDYAPSAPPLYTSVLESAGNRVFFELPVGWYGDWHPTPVRRWLILVTQRVSLKLGRVREQFGRLVTSFYLMIRLVKVIRKRFSGM